MQDYQCLLVWFRVLLLKLNRWKKSSEAQLAINHLHNLKKKRIPDEKSLVTYDLGYTSFDLIFNHLYLGIDFLIKLKDSRIVTEIGNLTTPKCWNNKIILK